MQFTYVYKIIENPLHSFYKEGNFEPLKRLGEKNHAEPSNLLKI